MFFTLLLLATQVHRWPRRLWPGVAAPCGQPRPPSCCQSADQAGRQPDRSACLLPLFRLPRLGLLPASSSNCPRALALSLLHIIHHLARTAKVATSSCVIQAVRLPSPPAVRCNVAFNLGATEPWTPASTPLHFAAAGRGRVVQAILQAAAEQDQEAVAQGRHTIDIRLLSDFRGKAQQQMSGQSRRAVCGLLRECGRRCSTMLHSFHFLSQLGRAHPCYQRRPVVCFTLLPLPTNQK